MTKDYYIYVMTNKKYGTLYVGVTNDLKRRNIEHKEGRGSQFTRRYGLKRLDYFEHFTDPEYAIRREKQLKGGSRTQKTALIDNYNPDWKDIFDQLS